MKKVKLVLAFMALFMVLSSASGQDITFESSVCNFYTFVKLDIPSGLPTYGKIEITWTRYNGSPHTVAPCYFTDNNPADSKGFLMLGRCDAAWPLSVTVTVTLGVTETTSLTYVYDGRVTTTTNIERVTVDTWTRRHKDTVIGGPVVIVP